MFKVHVRWPNGNISEFLIDKDSFMLGRDQANDVFLPSSQASRTHAKVFARSGEVFIEDLNSANGTFVGKKKVGTPVAITSKDPVKLADVFIRVFYKHNAKQPVSAESSSYSLAQKLGDSRRTVAISGEMGKELRKLFSEGD